ncbi:MAG: hypothetical protein K5821_17255, partial [Nitrobacter sp.]|uniref:hypothetical protein n=1 Tax=Nitrobacter sp. TaxID=29420 RepID=UPI002628BBBC
LRGVRQFALTESEHAALQERGDRVWLLRIGAGDASNEKVKEWIERAERDGIHKRFLCASRKPWYALGSIIPPDVLVSPMTNGKFKAVTNPIQAIPSNALYGLYLDHAALAVPLVRWLNGAVGQTAMAAAARTYGSGLLKLEPSDLSSISVPATADLLAESTNEDAVLKAHAQ